MGIYEIPLQRSGFRAENEPKKGPKSLFLPVIRENPAETGSHMTAHTTSQSSQTAEIVVDRKQAVSAGIFVGIVPLFWSPETPAVFQADF